MSKFVGESEDLCRFEIVLIDENQESDGVANAESLEFVRIKTSLCIGPDDSATHHDYANLFRMFCELAKKGVPTFCASSQGVIKANVIPDIICNVRYS